ncbi:hypothetical protein [Listeria booriae]|uniref:Uncharacterized protein n=1 Tax=Listeria booriae TaxID=1552123 RepID=A0A841YT77_9LIST|nr:hypothetical protein [Listeria booriae]MBC1212455.1 hypothetical protein [Listeria booriae]MBC1309331.1 hypothetical protein [Listeria booriae]MBC1403104.1 hypothetical protein [Listeria booriae]MBC1617940.1 hypothetical protein [Listeria booriae]
MKESEVRWAVEKMEHWTSSLVDAYMADLLTQIRELFYLGALFIAYSWFLFLIIRGTKRIFVWVLYVMFKSNDMPLFPERKGKKNVFMRLMRTGKIKNRQYEE